MPALPQSVYEQNKNIVDLPEPSLTKIFPTPAFYKESSGQFLLAGHFNIVVKKEDGLDAEKEYLETELNKLLKKSNGREAIQILLKKDASNSDVYRLQITPKTISIVSGTGRGIFYAIQSLKTLIPHQAYKAAQESITLPIVNVIDSARFPHRAFLLDVARNFQTKEEVLKVLDLMSLYK
ncbi:MAG: beta-N-acetylhexosaminidase, partial [Chitinophagaceae bacterium]